MPIYHNDVIQGTPEWADLRLGIPCSSQFDRIITPSGKPSKAAEKYMFELLAERILLEPTTGYTSHWMDRGSELEAKAVAYFEFTTETKTFKIGFVTNDARTVGASPDRGVGERALVEIKVPTPGNHVAYLLERGSAYDDHRVQAQGQLWICERDTNFLMSFCPGMPNALYRVERDEPFIKKMAEEVMKFSDELEELSIQMESRGILKRDNPKPIPPESQMDAIDQMRSIMQEVNAR